MFPRDPGYTFIRNNTASRLDRIYVPGRLRQFCQQVEIVPVAFSDHQCLSSVIRMRGAWRGEEGNGRRSSYWKLNNSVLDHHDFLNNFEHTYRRLQLSKEWHHNAADWWEESAKPVIQTFLKQFSIMVSRERKHTKEMLYILLKVELQRGMAGFAAAMDIKNRISNLLVIEAEGLKVRSRFKENLEKEKASLFHLAREKKKGAENSIEKLLLHGQEVNDPVQCEREVIGFYEPLFNGRQGRPQPFIMDEGVLQEFLTDRVGKLQDHDRDALDQPFTEEELKVCIKSLPNNKSPGLCGMSNEFYKKVYHIIKSDYLAVQNGMCTRGKISPSMRRGVTRLAPKVDGVPRVDQLRPITMLAADYNIKSRMMTRRVGQHMEDLIQSGQLCSRSKKNILSGVHNILSSVEYVNQKQLPAAVLSFDMDKAFDRCYIPYVCKVLKHMNFSDTFIETIKDMHSGISTRFILSKLTNEILLTFSIRQGDAIAMFLYIIYMEPFLLSLSEICRGL